MKKLTVKAGPNGPVFMADMPRVLDDGGKDVNVIRDEPVEVPDTRYYRNRIRAGDLVLVSEAKE